MMLLIGYRNSIVPYIRLIQESNDKSRISDYSSFHVHPD